MNRLQKKAKRLEKIDVTEQVADILDELRGAPEGAVVLRIEHPTDKMRAEIVARKIKKAVRGAGYRCRWFIERGLFRNDYYLRFEFPPEGVDWKNLRRKRK